jgi:hypothetical protein
MPKFRVFVHGINFQMRAPDKDVAELLGFYTIGFVDALSPQKAEELVIGLLRDHTDLREDVLNPQEDPPRFFVEEIAEIADWPTDTKRPLTGLVFYNDPDVSWRKDNPSAKSN